MELDIYFKNVGQGDTIFLHWDNNNKFGLIDCNLVNKKITHVIKHIEQHSIKEFEFMLMSHPHSDHFSGFPELLGYCESKGIVIKKFFHTATFVPRRLDQLFEVNHDKNDHYEKATSSVNRRKHKDLLWSLFTRLDEQHKIRPNGFIKAVHTITNDYPIAFPGFFQMNFLAPYDYDEFEQYIRQTYNISRNERWQMTTQYENNPKGNFLSSLIQIAGYSGNWQVLLCSDVTEYTLRRISDNDMEFNQILNKELKAAQIPHHGSDKNHYPIFWDKLNNVGNAHAVISVGNGYGHPHVRVINYFKEKCQSVHATNYVGGFKDAFEMAPPEESIVLMGLIMDIPGISVGPANEVVAWEDNTRCGEKLLKIISEDGNTSCDIIDV